MRLKATKTITEEISKSGSKPYEQDIKNMQKILDLLDEDDDVQEVYHNWDE